MFISILFYTKMLNKISNITEKLMTLEDSERAFCSVQEFM